MPDVVGQFRWRIGLWSFLVRRGLPLRTWGSQSVWSTILKEHPRCDANLMQNVEHLITERGRGNYQVACRYLVKIRSLYEKLDEPEQWTNYITALRKLHSRLPTLKEELTAAGL